MADEIVLDGDSLTVDQVVEVARHRCRVRLSDAARGRVGEARSYLERILADGRSVYGVNTGVGGLGGVAVSPDAGEALQRNILRSHAAGTGRPVPTEVVRAMLLLRANALAKGHSGITPATLETLLELLNRGVHPIVPAQGSVGASGDLAPLSHAALVLVGEGMAEVGGAVLPGGEALRRVGLEAVRLGAKEGLALNNGTQFMTALGALALHDAERLLRSAVGAAALTVEAMRGLRDSWDPRVHRVRPHPGGVAVAAEMRRLLRGSRYTLSSAEVHSMRVWRGPQDPYSVRAIPQVIGPCLDLLSRARSVVDVELNSATDDPLFFPGQHSPVVYCANFHGQPVAAALDVTGLAVATLGIFSERRTALLTDVSLNHGLPPFLVHPEAEPGINTGLMIAQITGAALAAEVKAMAHPASVDSIPTSAGFEDFVSMGAYAGRKARRAVETVEALVAIELLCAAQAVDIRGGAAMLGEGTSSVFEAVRGRVPMLVEDRVVADDVAAVVEAVRSGAVARLCGLSLSGGREDP